MTTKTPAGLVDQGWRARGTFRPCAAPLLLAFVLVGCGMSQTNFDAAQEALRGSPALRQQTINECVSNIRAKPAHVRQGMATVMNTSLANAPATYCQRLIRGISSGRLERSDVNAGMRGQLTPNVIRVLQGR